MVIRWEQTPCPSDVATAREELESEDFIDPPEIPDSLNVPWSWRTLHSDDSLKEQRPEEPHPFQPRPFAYSSPTRLDERLLPRKVEAFPQVPHPKKTQRARPTSARLADLPSPVAQSGPHPRRETCTPARYPRLARLRGWEGTVTLEVQVDETGRVMSVRIKKGSGHKILDQAAREAVCNWRFTPGRRDGSPCAAVTTVSVTFALHKGSTAGR